MSVTTQRRSAAGDITFHPVLDLPGGAGPTGRRLYKDDDGTLVGELVDEITERRTGHAPTGTTPMTGRSCCTREPAGTTSWTELSRSPTGTPRTSSAAW